jgi:hypothetical protein
VHQRLISAAAAAAVVCCRTSLVLYSISSSHAPAKSFDSINSIESIHCSVPCANHAPITALVGEYSSSSECVKGLVPCATNTLLCDCVLNKCSSESINTLGQ